MQSCQLTLASLDFADPHRQQESQVRGRGRSGLPLNILNLRQDETGLQRHLRSYSSLGATRHSSRQVIFVDGLMGDN